jgi:AhpD family alkylhydroperoxidase
MLGDSATNAGIPETTLYMLQLRASQINGCAVCVDIHSRELEYAGESSERIHTVATWRETPYFSDAERAALALTEAATRLRPDVGFRGERRDRRRSPRGSRGSRDSPGGRLT